MQNIELAYLAVAYGMAGIMLYITRHHTYPTVSHIALHKKSTRHVFFWGLFTASILFAILMYGWAIPHFSLGLWIKILVAIIVLSVTLAGLFPVEGKRFRKAHLFFGGVLGISMFTFITSLAFTGTLHSTVRVINGLIALGMLTTCATVTNIKNEEFLLQEKIFFALWHSAIFITIYFG